MFSDIRIFFFQAKVNFHKQWASSDTALANRFPRDVVSSLLVKTKILICRMLINR